MFPSSAAVNKAQLIKSPASISAGAGAARLGRILWNHMELWCLAKQGRWGAASSPPGASPKLHSGKIPARKK